MKEIDLLKIIDGTDPSADVIVQANDLITVPKAKMIYVVGDVGKPGGYVLDGHSSSLTVLQAIALAGGINKTAAMGNTKILRTATGSDTNRVESEIDMKKIMASKAPDITLHANDILFVPTSAAKNAGLQCVGDGRERRHWHCNLALLIRSSVWRLSSCIHRLQS